MSNNEDQYQLLEDLHFVLAKIRDEGFHYCFKHYSSFKEIKDPKFHELRKSYLTAADELQKYIETKINDLNYE